MMTKASNGNWIDFIIHWDARKTKIILRAAPRYWHLENKTIKYSQQHDERCGVCGAGLLGVGQEADYDFWDDFDGHLLISLGKVIDS